MSLVNRLRVVLVEAAERHSEDDPRDLDCEAWLDEMESCPFLMKSNLSSEQREWLASLHQVEISSLHLVLQQYCKIQITEEEIEEGDKLDMSWAEWTEVVDRVGTDDLLTLATSFTPSVDRKLSNDQVSPQIIALGLAFVSTLCSF